MSRPDEKQRAAMEVARAAYETQLQTAADALVVAIRAGVTDGAETISHLLATAAANLGGMHMLTVGRPRSWEADYVDQFLGSTVGPDGDYLLQYRTAPIEIVECVEILLGDLGISWLYDEAFDLVDQAEGEACNSEDEAVAEAASARFVRAEGLIEQLRERDFAAYMEAFEARVREAADELRRTRYLPDSVPVRVRWVEWKDRDQAISGIDGRAMDLWGTVEFELWETARLATPPPGFVEPLSDISGEGDAGSILRASGRMPHQRIAELAHYAQPDKATRATGQAGGRGAGGSR